MELKEQQRYNSGVTDACMNDCDLVVEHCIEQASESNCFKERVQNIWRAPNANKFGRQNFLVSSSESGFCTCHCAGWLSNG